MNGAVLTKLGSVRSALWWRPSALQHLTPVAGRLFIQKYGFLEQRLLICLGTDAELPLGQDCGPRPDAKQLWRLVGPCGVRMLGRGGSNLAL